MPDRSLEGKGAVIREKYEATCSGYDELYRAEQYEKFFVALKRVRPQGRVLDAGCGTGLLLEYMASYGSLDAVDSFTCLDYSPCMLSIARFRIGVLCGNGSCIALEGNVEKLPFGSGVFDTVYSFTVLDLVDDLWRAVKELIRVSRGPVVVSMLKRLPYKDELLAAGAQILGVTSKDVIMRIDVLRGRVE
ncbi:putative methyltransferase [Aeropyrum pernix]|uniref:Putative methyltransferase n=1 Tax=Aeropyrum pernix TaxID=56636 RepID=A0A401HBF3_AERPX|nr:class I SAM-dependent methyltransferase [Aeropyrum pernix]GBF09771.1 putative methyltransferase [Aeropyrum pernix]